MARELSVEAKQTFQIVALLSTIAVVAIHYQSAAPPTPSPHDATWNELAQEFLLGGIARVAVPLFALAAGLFYFRSGDRSLKTYLKKLNQRGRTVLLPYFVIASVAVTSWLVVRKVEGDPVTMTWIDFLATWLLRPPAEQLWFLRDLMVLVAIAPLIRLFVDRAPTVFLAALGILWCSNWQPFPVIAGWHMIHTETLLFFTVGCVAVRRSRMIENLGTASRSTVAGLLLVWFDLVIARIFMRADFDSWYLHDYTAASLIMYKVSILVGCVATFALCWKLRSERLIRLSGAAFFVYLVHEFPLRAAIERAAETSLDKAFWFWITMPAAVVVCFVGAALFNRFIPSLAAVVTGGRTPESAARIAAASSGAVANSFPATSAGSPLA